VHIAMAAIAHAAQDFLDASEAGTVRQKMGRKGTPKLVGGCLAVYASLLDRFFERQFRGRGFRLRPPRGFLLFVRGRWGDDSFFIAGDCFSGDAKASFADEPRAIVSCKIENDDAKMSLSS